MTSTVRLVLPFVMAIGMLSSAARAETSPECREAEVIFRDGLKKREDGQFAEAVPVLKRSLALCRSPGLGALYNLALAEEALGRIAAAYLHNAEFLLDVHVGEGVIDDRIEDAKKVMASLRTKGTPLHLVNLDKLPRGSSVTVDDAAVRVFTRDYELPAEPGTHLVVIREPGRTERSLSVHVVPGKPAPVDVVRPPEPSKFTARNVGFVIAGVGVANLIAGAVTGGLAWDKREQLTEGCAKPESFCTNKEDLDKFVNDGKTLGTASTATFIIGGALTALGATFVFWPQSKSKENALVPKTALAPLVLPGGGGLSFSARF